MPFDIHQPLALLGGISPAHFMQHYWQREPLLVRQAFAAFQPPVSTQTLFALAGQEDVESRLIQSQQQGWELQHGPFSPRQLPSKKKPAWTLLVQGVDLHDDQAHALLQQFAFLPQARLDDLMISYASDGGGVGPHFDSYDVFLLQAQGQRRWRIGRQSDLSLQEGVPLKILRHFEPEFDWVLEPGDMLYLPPRYAHDGIAVGNDCMTCSVGFRAPQRQELAQSVLEKIVDSLYDESEEGTPAVLYEDAGQQAVQTAGAIPVELQQFALDAVTRALHDGAIEQALGEYLTEPKPNVFFDREAEDNEYALAEANESGSGEDAPWHLNRKTRMVYDSRFVYINGESYECSGMDADLLHRLADQRWLDDTDFQHFSPTAQEIVQDWYGQGWLQRRDPAV